MSLITKIEWCHHTTNLALGCQKLSAGCKHCYAADLSRINPGVLGTWGPDGTRVLRPEAWRRDILAFARKARKAGERRRVFVNSMSDLAEGVTVNGRESETEIRPDYLPLWDVVLSVASEVADALDLLTLTKRPRILAGVLEGRDLPPNLWIGASVEDQAAADARVPHLLRIPARVRFLSMEPLLGAVDLDPATCQYCGQHGENIVVADDGATPWCRECDSEAGFRWWLNPLNGGISWVIVGGESGRSARPMHPQWARDLRNQCQNAGVPFFFKQWGCWKPISQMTEEEMDAPYRSNRIARDGEDQAALDDSYGKTCTVPQLVIRDNGEHRETGDPLAFSVDAPGGHFMTAYKVGKDKAGRLLDGCEWNEVPR